MKRTVYYIYMENTATIPFASYDLSRVYEFYFDNNGKKSIRKVTIDDREVKLYEKLCKANSDKKLTDSLEFWLMHYLRSISPIENYQDVSRPQHREDLLRWKQFNI